MIFYQKEHKRSNAGTSRLVELAKIQEETPEIQIEDYQKIKREAQKLVTEKVETSLLGDYTNPRAKEEIKKYVIQTIQKEYPGLQHKEKLMLAEKITNEISGYGIIEKFRNDPDVTEIIVERYDKIVVEKHGKLHETGEKFYSEEDLRLVAERIVAPLGRRLDQSSPTVDARLQDGSRVNIVIPPIAVDGTQMAIRKFKPNISMDKLIEYGSLTEKIKEGLTKCVQGRLNILVSGGTGSGKSTFLNALSEYIDHGLSIITIENPIELSFKHPRVRRWEARPPNIEGQGEISMRHLVINALRSRPDIIIIGEVRGSEAYDLIQAMNTGHDGSLSTCHANNTEEALKRLVAMVVSARELPRELVPSYVAGAVDLVIQLSRLKDGSRKLVEISEVIGEENGRILTNKILRYRQTGFDENGKIIGDWEVVNEKFHKAEKLIEQGIEWNGWL